MFAPTPHATFDYSQLQLQLFACSVIQPRGIDLIKSDLPYLRASRPEKWRGHPTGDHPRRVPGLGSPVDPFGQKEVRFSPNSSNNYDNYEHAVFFGGPTKVCTVSIVPCLSHPIMIWLQLFCFAKSQSNETTYLHDGQLPSSLGPHKNWFKSLAETGWKKSKVNSNLLRRENKISHLCFCANFRTTKTAKERRSDPQRYSVIAVLVQIKDGKKIGHDFRRPIECANHRRTKGSPGHEPNSWGKFLSFSSVLYSQFVIQKGENRTNCGCV